MTSALSTEQHGPWRRNTCGHLDAMTKEARAEDTRRWLDQFCGNGGNINSMDEADPIHSRISDDDWDGKYSEEWQ